MNICDICIPTYTHVDYTYVCYEKNWSHSPSASGSYSRQANKILRLRKILDELLLHLTMVVCTKYILVSFLHSKAYIGFWS